MSEFVSERISPVGGTFDAAAMGRGEPGLPESFQWRDGTYRVISTVSQWKDTSAEGGSAGRDVYLRRHCYELEMESGDRWVVYFVRQTPKSGTPKARWFLYTIATED